MKIRRRSSLEDIIKTILNIEREALEKEKQGEIDLQQMESRRIVLLKKIREQIETEKKHEIEKFMEKMEKERVEEFAKIQSNSEEKKIAFQKRYEDTRDKIVDDALEVVLRSLEGYDG